MTMIKLTENSWLSISQLRGRQSLRGSW